MADIVIIDKRYLLESNPDSNAVLPRREITTFVARSAADLSDILTQYPKTQDGSEAIDMAGNVYILIDGKWETVA